MYQKTTKPESVVSDWDRAAMAYAKARQQGDGAIGAVVTAGHAGDEWVRYFRYIGMVARARFADHQLRNGGSLTVPTEFPHQYDPTFVPGIYRPDRRKGPQEREIERVRVAAKLREMRSEMRPAKPLGQTETLLSEVEKRQAAERWLENAREIRPEPIKVSEKLRSMMKPTRHD
jgi:hypothetical protein